MAVFNSFFESVSKQFANKLPFVIFSLPESDTVQVILQKDAEVYNTETYAEECFVFAPFDYQDKAFCIPKEKGKSFEFKMEHKTIDFEEVSIQEELKTKETYIDKIKNVIVNIKIGNAKKIVFSRKKEVDLKQFDLSILISRILDLYPTAFRYIWYHPETGLWCGATPEVLLKTQDISFSTMALAGTQKVIDKKISHWSVKEITEQKIVVDAIATSLQRVTSVLKISKTYNYKAASLVHLRTDISGILKKGKTTLSSITSVLHPTPAVCGTPQKFAKKYILENENYNREFYTGFLGPVCAKDSCSNLFVNLRCMKIENKKVNLFVGGGITIDSNPESEWEETNHKLQTMLQVLSPML